MQHLKSVSYLCGSRMERPVSSLFSSNRSFRRHHVEFKSQLIHLKLITKNQPLSPNKTTCFTRVYFKPHTKNNAGEQFIRLFCLLRAKMKRIQCVKIRQEGRKTVMEDAALEVCFISLWQQNGAPSLGLVQFQRLFQTPPC